MFDKHYHDHVTKVGGGPRRVDVHEHRAPTDASVRLLSEMEQKVLERVIFSQPIEANGVKGSVTHMFNPVTDGSMLYVSFVINEGRRQTSEIKLKENYMLDQWEYAKYLVMEVAQAIAVQLLQGSEEVKRMFERTYHMR
jgi:hypothetical protein